LAGLSHAAEQNKPFNLGYDHVPGELIVKFKRNAFSVASILQSSGVTRSQKISSNGAILVSFKGGHGFKETDLMTKARELAARSDVEYVEANTILRSNDTVPNDADFSKLYGMHNTGENGGKAGADIKAVKAWDITTGSKDVVVAVIDTGINYEHPDIKPNYWNNPGEMGLDSEGKDKSTNEIDDDGNGYVDDFRGWNFVADSNDPMDDQSHGTHCAGVIGGSGNDGVGIVGVNWNVSLVGIKFLDAGGGGSLANATKAIEYATKLGVTLTSNSWGGGGFSQTMYDAIKASQAKGQLFIAAAGNDHGNDNDSKGHYPSTYDLDNIIAVAASDNADKMATFSNFGQKSVHIAAPGVDIYSSVLESEYKKMSGTSMATPHVAGAAALVKAAYPDATYLQIKDRILNGAEALPEWTTKVSSGGRLNLANSLENDSVAPSPVSQLAVASVTMNTVTLSWKAAGDDGEVGSAASYLVRYSEAPITTDEQWAAAKILSGEVKVEEQTASATYKFDELELSGFISIRAKDNVGNISKLSDSVAFKLKELRRVYENKATSLEGVVAEKPWALEEVTADDDSTYTVFSDSPDVNYETNKDTALRIDNIVVSSASAFLIVDQNFEVESKFDFYFVEASTDNGKTWKKLAEYSGSSKGWRKDNYTLPVSDREDKAVSVRFRLKSDYTVNKDGIKIRNITVMEPVD
jgi:subtilisin family serine protease